MGLVRVITGQAALVHKLRIAAVLCHQFRVCPLLYNHSAIDNSDTVREFHGLEPMRNDDGGWAVLLSESVAVVA